jgi:SAM-dependent methyltransferase
MTPPAQDARFPPSPTTVAREWVCRTLRPGDIAIDATAGNGHDTLWLAEAVGATGRVLAFDIQPEALDAAAARVTQAGLAERVKFHLGSHEGIGAIADPGSVAAVVFNLGYLPGHGHAVKTSQATTLAGLNAAIRVLRPGGVLAVVCYPGHEGGDEETHQVELWFRTLGSHGARVVRYGAVGTLRPPPMLLLAAKPWRGSGSDGVEHLCSARPLGDSRPASDPVA